MNYVYEYVYSIIVVHHLSHSEKFDTLFQLFAQTTLPQAIIILLKTNIFCAFSTSTRPPGAPESARFSSKP